MCCWFNLLIPLTIHSYALKLCLSCLLKKEMNNGQITVQPQVGKEKQIKKSLLLQGRMINTKKELRCSVSMTKHFSISYPDIRSKGTVEGGGRAEDITLFIKCFYFNIRCSVVTWWHRDDRKISLARRGRHVNK